MFNRLTLVTPPATAALSLVDAKAHLRVLHDDEDDLIEGLVDAAIAMIDGPDGVGFCMVAQSWALALDRFCGSIRIPLRPVASITSITYLDAAGASQTVDSGDYRLALSGGVGVVDLVPGAAWPAVGDFDWPVTVTFVAGTGAPPALVVALKMIIGDLYKNREGQGARSAAVEDILNRYRSGVIAA